MPRKPFNTDCDIFKGPGTNTPGLYVGTFDCRFVIEDGIHAIGAGCPWIPAYLTIEGYEPQGAWTTPFFGMDASLCDQIAVPSGQAKRYFVLYTDVIIWNAQAAYYRAYLVSLPLPSPGTQGGIELGGSAIVTTFHSVVGNGGIELGGDTSSQVTHKRYTLGEGGIELGGIASWSFTPGSPYYLEDTFTDTDGTPLTTHIPEHGSLWTAMLATSVILNNRSEANSFVSGNSAIMNDVGHNSYTIKASVFIPGIANTSQNFPVVLVRTTDLANTWYCYTAFGSLYLESYVGGVQIEQQNVVAGVTAGASWLFEVVVDPATGVAVTLNGHTLTSATNANPGITDIALLTISTTGFDLGVSWEYITVEP